jgi:hypothetical protein
MKAAQIRQGKQGSLPFNLLFLQMSLCLRRLVHGQFKP